MQWGWLIGAAVGGYLLGSLSFAVIVSRIMGLNDPRTYGSKNPGATNVLRSGSKAAAVLTLLLDAVKGWLPVLVARWAGLDVDAQALAGLAAFMGHLYPVFFRFVGGKGVATAAGVLLAFSPWLGLCTLLTWVAVAYVFRYSSLASLAAAVLAVVWYVLGDGVLWQMDRYTMVAVVVMALFLVARHWANIQRLVQGTESKLGSKKKSP